MLNEPTLKRLLAICTKVSKKQSVADHDLAWAQKNAIYSEEAAALLDKVNAFVPAAEQEDTTEV
jgi:hypothetical protein